MIQKHILNCHSKLERQSPKTAIPSYSGLDDNSFALAHIRSYSVTNSSTGDTTITPELVVPVLPEPLITEIT